MLACVLHTVLPPESVAVQGSFIESLEQHVQELCVTVKLSNLADVSQDLLVADVVYQIVFD